MNEDRVVGTATNVGGKAQEGLGRASGDVRTQAKGVINQAAEQQERPMTFMVRRKKASLMLMVRRKKACLMRPKSCAKELRM